MAALALLAPAACSSIPDNVRAQLPFGIGGRSEPSQSVSAVDATGPDAATPQTAKAQPDGETSSGADLFDLYEDDPIALAIIAAGAGPDPHAGFDLAAEERPFEAAASISAQTPSQSSGSTSNAGGAQADNARPTPTRYQPAQPPRLSAADAPLAVAVTPVTDDPAPAETAAPTPSTPLPAFRATDLDIVPMRRTQRTLAGAQGIAQPDEARDETPAGEPSFDFAPAPIFDAGDPEPELEPQPAPEPQITTDAATGDDQPTVAATDAASADDEAPPTDEGTPEQTPTARIAVADAGREPLAASKAAPMPTSPDAEDRPMPPPSETGDETAAGPRGAPALWRIADADSAVYLFGSLHALPKGATWRTRAFDQAMADSEVTVFEADAASPQGLADIERALRTWGFNPAGVTLADEIGERRFERAAALADGLGLTASALAPMRPWLALVSLSQAVFLSYGFDPAAGVEATVLAQGKREGDAFRHLETPEEQVRALAELSREDMLANFDATLEQLSDIQATTDRMLTAWRTGDLAELEAVTLAPLKSGSPSAYDALFTRRNVAWTGRIAEMLGEDDDYFVTIGVGHLVGEDSVIRLLEARGLRAERIQ